VRGFAAGGGNTIVQVIRLLGEDFSHRQGTTSLKAYPANEMRSNLMEDPGTGLLEKQQEDILRAFGHFLGKKSCIFCSLGESGKRVCSI
jgi:hypothetical protein